MKPRHFDFIGRDHELGIIKDAFDSNRAELGVVYGRRRVGKSSLLKYLTKKVPFLYFEGLQKTSGKKQISHFLEDLARQTGTPLAAATSWKNAFEALSLTIKKGAWYVVFDEFPWMAGGRSELVSLLKYFWDNFWKENPKLTLVLCGSVAQFMIHHVIHSHALHNRKTFEIHLQPFSSAETALFFKKSLDDEVLRYLLVFGGIPKYLEQIDTRQSFTKNIERLCFQKDGFFVEEFNTLFKEQFKTQRIYTKIIQAMSRGACTRDVLSNKLGLASGGGLSLYIENLENAGFVKTFTSYSPKGWLAKTRQIYLWDEWLRFYFNFMHPHREVIAQNTGPGLFESLSSKRFDVFCGIAFERLCLKNIKSICAHLGTTWSKVKNFGPFFRQPPRSDKASGQGLQIDILLERTDDTLMIFECKYSQNPVGLNIIPAMEKKIKLLAAPRHKRTEKILVAPGGVSQDLMEADYFHHIVDASALLRG